MARMRINFRFVAIVLAVILAVVAAVALLSYIRGLESRTQAEFEPLDVFVAVERIEAGTPAEMAVAGGLIEPRAVPRSAVPAGAITSTAQIEGTVAVVDILPGEVVVAARFGDAPQTVRGLREFPDEKEAISVQVSVPPGVAGFLTGGDRVSIIAQLEIPEDDDADDETATDATLAGFLTRYLIQDVEVLAVGRRIVQGDTDEVQQTEQVLVTLAVDPEEAERLVFAALNGSLYFTLLPEEPFPDRPIETPGRTIDNIFD
jgi:pilus assembly protein CpaB